MQCQQGTGTPTATATQTPSPTPDPLSPPALDPVQCTNSSFNEQVYLQQVTDLNLTYNPWEYWEQYYASLQTTPSLAILPEDTVGGGNEWWEQLTLNPLHGSDYAQQNYQRDIPEDCAIEFGAKGIIKEVTRQQLLGITDTQRVKLIGFREATGGFEYGRGIMLYDETSNEFIRTRLTLSETEIRLASLIMFHETSEYEYGDALGIMFGWAAYNVLFSTNKVYNLTGDDLYHAILRANWRSTYNWLTGSNTTTINIAHEMRLATEPDYLNCYRAAKRAAQDYMAGLPDPVNRGAGAQSEPQLVVSDQNFNMSPQILAAGIIYYNTGPNMLEDYFTNSGTQGVEQYLMFRGTFVRVENENNATHLVNWRFLINDTGSALDRNR